MEVYYQFDKLDYICDGIRLSLGTSTGQVGPTDLAPVLLFLLHEEAGAVSFLKLLEYFLIFWLVLFATNHLQMYKSFKSKSVKAF